MKIIPLSKSNVNEAIKLIEDIFNSKPSDFDSPRTWFPASLNSKSKESKEIYEKYGTRLLKYFVGVEHGKIIGTTGIYTTKDDEKDTAWLGWYCVSPEYRGKGYGNELIDFIIAKAKKMKKKYLKLYTSENLDIERAMEVYKKKGFKITGKNKHLNTNEEMIYLSLNLK